VFEDVGQILSKTSSLVEARDDVGASGSSDTVSLIVFGVDGLDVHGMGPGAFAAEQQETGSSWEGLVGLRVICRDVIRY